MSRCNDRARAYGIHNSSTRASAQTSVHKQSRASLRRNRHLETRVTAENRQRPAITDQRHDSPHVMTVHRSQHIAHTFPSILEHARLRTCRCTHVLGRRPRSNRHDVARIGVHSARYCDSFQMRKVSGYAATARVQRNEGMVVLVRFGRGILRAMAWGLVTACRSPARQLTMQLAGLRATCQTCSTDLPDVTSTGGESSTFFRSSSNSTFQK